MPRTNSSESLTLPTSKSHSKSLVSSRSGASMRGSVRSRRDLLPDSSINSDFSVEARGRRVKFPPNPKKVVERSDNGMNMLKFQQQLRAMDWSAKDLKDLSYQPSYSEYEIPYYVLCLIRYREARIKYEKQLQWEIKNLLTQQSTAYDETLLGRPFYITTLWPPMHSRREMEHTHQKCFTLSDKERRRIHELMTTNVI